jgi:acyl transferase domain-containing protein
MEEVGPELENMLQSRFHFNTPKIPMYSTVLGRALTEQDQLNARYWKQNLESPVLFSTAVSEALQVMSRQVSCFVEVGPNCTLLSPIKQVVRSQSLKTQPHYVHTLQKDQDQAINILEAAGQLFLNGVPISFHTINGTGKCLTNLPPYPWDYSVQQWKESRISKEWRLRKFPHHELLGSRAMGSNDLEPSWRNILSLDNSRWLCDHKFSDTIVFPSAGYIAAVAEAVRQISGKTAYTFRDVFIKNALFLDEYHDMEMMTVLRPVRLTDILDSEWFEFSVSAYNGKGWTKHCTGQVMGVERSVSSPPKREVYHRHVNSPNHYEALRKCGLNYGPHFQGLENVTADPNLLRATANLTSETVIDELETYSIHPTIIDKALQLITVAASRGLARAVDRVAVPISFDRIYLASTSLQETFAIALCTSTTDNSFAGNTFAQSNNESILEIQGVRAFVMDAEAAFSDPSHAVCSARMDWKPDIEFIPMSTLLPPANSNFFKYSRASEPVVVLHLIKMWRSIENITPTKSHLKKYKQWVENQMRDFRTGEHKLLPASDTQEWVTLSSDRISSLIQEKESDPALAEMASGNSLIRFFQSVMHSAPEFLQGRRAVLDVLMEDSGLETYYNLTVGHTDCGEFLSLLGHSRPGMRVLEIGAGTGSLTSIILEGLKSPAGGMMYSEYVFTDISPGFFSPAKERFNRFPGITFKTLDITKDPLEQGLGGFDLVVAANVFFARNGFPLSGKTLIRFRFSMRRHHFSKRSLTLENFLSPVVFFSSKSFVQVRR